LLQTTETALSFLIQSSPAKKAECFHVFITPVTPLFHTKKFYGALNELIVCNRQYL